MERDTWFQFPVPFLAVCFILLVLTLTHSFEIDEEFEKEEPPHTNHNKWFPSVALQDSHAGASKVTISSIFEDWISAPQK